MYVQDIVSTCNNCQIENHVKLYSNNIFTRLADMIT